MSPLAVGFVVQGEGRGHMTQALASADHLRAAGHDVVQVMVGTSPFRSTPAYFVERIGAPVRAFPAPTQVPDRAGRGVSVTRSAGDALRRLPSFFRAGHAIHRASGEVDVVVNFMDLVGGLSRVVYGTRTPSVSVAHNYIFLHPGLEGAPGRAWVRGIVLGYVRATALRSRSRIALSFDPLPDVRETELVVAPPLLRAGLEQRTPRDEGYLLAYVLNAGYGDVLAGWHRDNPEVTVHCYVDGGAGALATEPAPGFHAHQLGQDRFLRHLEGCRAYVGTAGFESICEAWYLGKPALVVPTEGQYEQTLNAWDARRVGAARPGGYDDLDDFWRNPATPDPARVQAFRRWVARAPEILVREVERAAAAGRR